MSIETQTGAVITIATQQLQAFQKLLDAIDVETLDRIVKRLTMARENGNLIYLAGNGGSAAIASHWVNDLGKATKRRGQQHMKVLSLCDNMAWLTALANDEGYETVFAGQLDNHAQAGDVLIVISSSGNSLNLVRAVELAKTRGVVTIGFVGFNGGVLKDMVDEHVLISTEKGAYGLVEPAHDLICHILTACLSVRGEEV